MFKELLTTTRSFKRLGQTGFTANKLIYRWLISRKDMDANFPLLLKDAMQDLGCTYIKLGQLIASSPTIFPPEYVTAFQSCLDQTPPLPFNVIDNILKEELGKGYRAHFRHIDQQPLASASIAQVHAAETIAGEQVVLKIQKPDVKKTLETDFHFLTMATKILERFNTKAWKSSLQDIVTEMRNGMVDECDFCQEAENIEEFRRFLDRNTITDVVVPVVYPALSTAKVLVMERFYGVPLSDTAGVQRITSTPDVAVAKALNTWFMSLKQCRIYHADLHAGNVLMLNDGRVGFIDFGIVGRLSESTWEGLTSLATCLPARDFHALATALAKVGATSKAVDLSIFAQDLEALWQQITLDHLPAQQDPDQFFRSITLQLSKVSARHGIRFPREFTLLVKQFIYFDRYLSLLAPEMDMFDHERLDLMGIAV